MTESRKKPDPVLQGAMRKSLGFHDDSDEYCDTPRQRFTMIDDFPDLIKNSSGEAGSGTSNRKRFLSRGLTRLFRRATILSSSASSGVYKVTSFDGGGNKSYSESNLSRIHLGLDEHLFPASASSTLTKVKTARGTIPDSNVINSTRTQVKYAKVRPASMYALASYSTKISHRSGESINEEDEIPDKTSNIKTDTEKEKEKIVEATKEKVASKFFPYLSSR